MKEKVAIIDSLGAHGSSHHFYLFGQAIGLSNAGVNVSLYTNNVTKNPNYKGVKFSDLLSLSLVRQWLHTFNAL